jgi:hypothetical protein
MTDCLWSQAAVLDGSTVSLLGASTTRLKRPIFSPLSLYFLRNHCHRTVGYASWITPDASQFASDPLVLRETTEHTVLIFNIYFQLLSASAPM